MVSAVTESPDRFDPQNPLGHSTLTGTVRREGRDRVLTVDGKDYVMRAADELAALQSQGLTTALDKAKGKPVSVELQGKLNADNTVEVGFLRTVNGKETARVKGKSQRDLLRMMYSEFDYSDKPAKRPAQRTEKKATPSRLRAPATPMGAYSAAMSAGIQNMQAMQRLMLAPWMGWR